MRLLYASVIFLCAILFSQFSTATAGNCVLNSVDIQVGSCDDGNPDVIIFFDITGSCTVSEVCFLSNGEDIGCTDVSDIAPGNGQGINFTGLLSDTFYEFTFNLSDGSSYSGYSVLNGNCSGYICDCAGTQHTVALLGQNWLGDGSADNGAFMWEGQAVDFNCATWGYDCGDIVGAPTVDPYSVCTGSLPPYQGCIENCSPISMTLAQGVCADDNGDGTSTPVINMTFNIDGLCMVDQLCFSINGGLNYECIDLPAIDQLVFDGDGLNLINTTPNTNYLIYYSIAGNSSPIYSFANGNCGEFICDCAGTQHTVALLDQNWLGDGSADDGTFAWEGQAVDFNCATWGYDCGDIDGAPSVDPYGVCNGNIPPNNGCSDNCIPSSMTLGQGTCADDNQDGTITPVINMTFNIDGQCFVDQLCFSTDGGSNYQCIDLPELDQIVFDGNGLNLINTTPNTEYLVYFTIGGNSSPIYSFMNGNCDATILGCTNEFAVNYNPDATVEDNSCVYDDTICDCLGNEHTSGVLTWLGDGAADDGTFLWDGMTVDFNCSNWGYDCGDIAGSPSSDPYNVCAGGLPPNNGCAADDCSVTISNISENCYNGLLSLVIDFNVVGNCNYADLCYSINGGPLVCQDISWNPIGFGIGLNSPATNSQIVFYATLADGTQSPNYVYNTGNCDGEQCQPISMNFAQEECSDDNEDGIITPTIGITFNIDGDCPVEDICFAVNTNNYTCLTLAEYGITVSDGQSINLVNTTPNSIYTFYFTTTDGVSSVQTFSNGSCEGVITGCMNEYADNYNPDAESDDGSCSYSQNICDCAGTTHTIGALAWLDDNYGDIGGTEFFWDGLPVDFNCATWGFDCGDIPDSPTVDPYGVCAGNLPPENGCFDDDPCVFTDLVLEQACQFDEDNGVWITRILINTFYEGECVIEEICEQGVGATENCYSLVDAEILLGSGEGLFLTVVPNNTYTVTMSTPNGSISGDIFIGNCLSATFGCTNPYATNYDPNADDDNGTCIYNENICDCQGTEHSIGVLAWIGDGSADDGQFLWNGQEVNFNCAVWAYDCGDIDTIEEGDPYNVCSGGLPPTNGCGINEVFGCTDSSALNYDISATVDDGTCEYEEIIYGCTDPEASNYNPDATFDNNTCEYLVFGCTDPTATNYNLLATTDNGSCIYTDITGCTDPNANNYNPFASIDDGSCIYGCELPIIIAEPTCVDLNTDSYYISLSVTSIGSGAPYSVSNNINEQSLLLSQTGDYTFGPFENNSTVVLTVVSMNTPNCTYISEVITYSCSLDAVEGCTNPNALNYDTNANLDDGSCIFDCAYPMIDYSTFCEDGEEDVFYIEMDVTSLGNGAPYDVSNNINNETLSLNFLGTVTLGPYSNNEQVLYTIQSELLMECLLTSSLLTDDCTVVLIEGCTDQLATNYNADAMIDDGSCDYDFTICDCVGNVYSPSVLSQLGDGIPNSDIVNFNCEIWGYDCGDIAGAPNEDPNDVCNGNIPPLSGCTDNVNELSMATLNIYPNPSQGFIHISTTGLSSRLKVELYNSIGSLIISEDYTINSQTIKMDLSERSVSEGVYMIRVTDGTTSLEKRIVLKN